MSSHQLGGFEEESATQTGGIVVIVLACRAPVELLDCVKSLRAQDPVPEIMVVNSGGGDAASLLRSAGLDVPVLEFQEVRFAGAARNAGIEATRLPVVAFLASDCLAEPGWVAGRLARHRAGCLAVASAVVNSHPRNPFAWAAHISNYGRRLPGVPEHVAARYGVSYDRSLFTRHGLFRENMRTGEDTEFHRRLLPGERPVWAPEVRTVHRNPVSLHALMRDQFRRGEHAARAYDALYAVSPRQLAVRRWGAMARTHRIARRSLNGGDRAMAVIAWPLVMLGAASYGAGVARFHLSQRRRVSGPEWARQEARRAEKRKDWAGALEMWQLLLRDQPHRTEAYQPEARRGRARMLHRLKRFEEAREAYSSLVDDDPGDTAARMGLASTLGAQQDWEAALAHWELALAQAPSDLVAWRGLARTLRHLARIEDAETAFRELATRHPERADGFAGLLEIAALRHDHPAVIDLAGTLWRRHRTPSAAIQLVTSLVCVGRDTQAAAFIAGVAADSDVRPNLVRDLRLARHRAGFQWSRLADLLAEDRAAGRGNDKSLREEIQCLLALGRTDDLRRLLEASPPPGAAQLDGDRILAIAHSFGPRRVREVLLPLLHAPALWQLAGEALPCAVAVAEAGDTPRLREALQQIDEVSPTICRDRRLPLSAPFAATFLVSLERLRGWAPERAPGDGVIAERFARAIRRQLAFAEDAGGAGRLLDVSERFLAFGRAGHSLHVDVAVDLDDALAVADAIAAAIDRGAPLSVIRLGDGEGSFLPPRPGGEPLRHADQTHFFRTWWGRAGDAEEYARLEAELVDAIGSADIVGVPALDQFGRFIRLLSDERLKQPTGSMMRGYLRVLEYMMDDVPADPARMLTSSHFHESFVIWRLWDLILRRIDSCSVITCHAVLPARLAAEFGMTTRRTYLVSPEAKWEDAFSGAWIETGIETGVETGADRHFPDQFERLRRELEVAPGDLYLVAAGVLGKIYCHWIKSAGGIAIDIGSLADHWCGYRTRRSISALHAVSPVQPDDYARIAAQDPRAARLLAGVARSRSRRNANNDAGDTRCVT